MLYSYNLQGVQALEEPHPRVQLCNWLEEKLVAVENSDSKILFSDEAGFTRKGFLNFHRTTYAHQQQFSLNMWAVLLLQT